MSAPTAGVWSPGAHTFSPVAPLRSCHIGSQAQLTICLYLMSVQDTLRNLGRCGLLGGTWKLTRGSA